MKFGENREIVEQRSRGSETLLNEAKTGSKRDK